MGISHRIQSLAGSSNGIRYEPFSLVHFVTERCNAHCSHCFINFDNPPDQYRELSSEEIGRLTRNLGKSLYNVNITGGEPFIRNDMHEIVAAYLENSTVRSIVITTNGWFSNRIADFVRWYASIPGKCLITVSISIDDIEARHDEGRNLPGLFERAMESYHAVAGAGDKRIRANVTMTVTENNAGRVCEIRDKLRQADVHELFPVIVREQGMAHSITNRDAIAEGYRELCAIVSKDSPSGRRKISSAVHRAKNRISRRAILDTFLEKRYIAPCQAGSLFATIGADGTVYPCEILSKKFPNGKLRDYDMDFLKLWNDAPARSAAGEIRTTQCHCTFECAWTVNILANPSFWTKLLVNTVRELL